jgi:uncharacterized protein
MHIIQLLNTKKTKFKMTIEQRVVNDIKEAMKAKDEVRLRATRAIKAQFLLFSTSGSGEVLTDDAVIKIIQKMVKTRKESLAIYQQNNRPELAATEQEEIDVLETYLPKALSDTELEALVRESIAETGAASMKDMGKVIAATNKKAAGRADGATISGIVKRLLA